MRAEQHRFVPGAGSLPRRMRARARGDPSLRRPICTVAVTPGSSDGFARPPGRCRAPPREQLVGERGANANERRRRALLPARTAGKDLSLGRGAIPDARFDREQRAAESGPPPGRPQRVAASAGRPARARAASGPTGPRRPGSADLAADVSPSSRRVCLASRTCPAKPPGRSAHRGMGAKRQSIPARNGQTTRLAPLRRRTSTLLQLPRNPRSGTAGNSSRSKASGRSERSSPVWASAAATYPRPRAPPYRARARERRRGRKRRVRERALPTPGPRRAPLSGAAGRAARNGRRRTAPSPRRVPTGSTGEQGGERQDAPTPAAHGAPRFTARPAPPVARLAPDGGDPPVAPQNGPQRIRTGGISSSRLSTTSVSMSGRNQRAHFSQGIFAMPSTPMVTAEVGRIGLTSSQSW